jgi:hypothetical protein
MIDPVKYDAPLTPDDEILFSVASIVSLTCCSIVTRQQHNNQFFIKKNMP